MAACRSPRDRSRVPRHPARRTGSDPARRTRRAPLAGKHLRSAALAILLRAGRPIPLVEVHRELHLNGYAIASRLPVQRLADALAYEITKGRAVRVDRGIYRIGELNPGEYRRLSRPAAA